MICQAGKFTVRECRSQAPITWSIRLGMEVRFPSRSSSPPWHEGLNILWFVPPSSNSCVQNSRNKNHLEVITMTFSDGKWNRNSPEMSMDWTSWFAKPGWNLPKFWNEKIIITGVLNVSQAYLAFVMVLKTVMNCPCKFHNHLLRYIIHFKKNKKTKAYRS